MSEIDEKEMEEFMEDELQKDINQTDSINQEEVDRQLGEMGFIYDYVVKKLSEDSYCFSSKRKINTKIEKMHVVPAGKVEKGTVAFVSLCEEEFKKLEEKNEEVKE